LVLSFLGVAADELGAAVDDHLRGVDAAGGEEAGVLLLADGEVGRGEAVGPAVAVPVVDVLFESDDFDAVEGLIGAEFCEEGIGGRATGAAFGGEEFEDEGLFGAVVG